MRSTGQVLKLDAYYFLPVHNQILASRSRRVSGSRLPCVSVHLSQILPNSRSETATGRSAARTAGSKQLRTLMASAKTTPITSRLKVMNERTMLQLEKVAIALKNRQVHGA